MTLFICSTCGTQYPPSEGPPASCPICTDERQYVPASGQSWTTLERLKSAHSNKFRRLAAGLTTIETTPAFAIAQRAILVQTPAGNVLWDCIALIDEATIDLVKGMGSLTAIAISHPHYYTTMVEWSHAFGGVPIYLHVADRDWVMRADASVQFWDGDTMPIAPGLTLVRLGGHFAGGTVLHWPAGAGGKGALLSGDIVQVVQDNKSVSFMWSFPNFIPLSAPRVEGVVNSLRPYTFDRIHGAFADRTIWSDGKGVLERSADRYLKIIRGDGSYELQ